MSKKVVLLWDEEPDGEKALSKLLNDNGYEVLFAIKEIQCLRYLANRHIDLVLLDIKRNDLEGLMLTKKIKNRSKHKHTPVISITDTDIIGLISPNYSWGCDSYVMKPVDKAELLEKMDYLMEKFFY